MPNLSSTMQAITLHLTDGRSFHFTGPGGLREGDTVARVDFHPPRPLPEGCAWEGGEPEAPDSDNLVNETRKKVRELHG